jgi:class 3 adenylate cyclase
VFGSGRAILSEMRSLPSGTVTFLFTDVEGSTKLLHDLGAEEYPPFGPLRLAAGVAISVGG